MKMVKSLLLGSAAGLVAVAGAQAADLPVKAKAVEYVKVCSLYGVGYYYIPGTDTCIKIGGYVRYEAYHNYTTGNYVDRNITGRFTRNSTTFAQQARFRLPPFPTTTIGSFPQTTEIRAARAAWKRGDLDEVAYTAAMGKAIAEAVRRQEALGIDVLVHGEAERNDMV